MAECGQDVAQPTHPLPRLEVRASQDTVRLGVGWMSQRPRHAELTEGPSQDAEEVVLHGGDVGMHLAIVEAVLDQRFLDELHGPEQWLT